MTPKSTAALAPTATADKEGLALVPEANPVLPTPTAGRRSGEQSGEQSGKHRTSAFAAMRAEQFRRYYIGQLPSAVGSFVQQTAIAWLVLQLTGSASTLGLVLAAGGAPGLLLGPFGGSVADRFDNRRLLLVTQSLFALLAAALWLLAAAGHASIAVIVVISLANGVVAIVDSPARQAFVVELVPLDLLPSAVSLNGVVMNSARVVGPAIAGVLIVTVGTTPCFAVNAASYLIVIGVLGFVRPLSRPAAPPAGGSHGLREALRYVRSYPQLWLPLTMMSLVGLLAFNFNVLLPLLAKTTFGGNGGTFGLLSTMISIGSVLGSLSVGLVPHPKRQYLLYTALLFALAMALTALAPTLVLACVTLVFTGFFGFQFVTLCSASLQLHAAPALRGRVMALWVFVYLGTTPVGNVVSGWVSRAGGPRAMLWVGAAACLAAALIAVRVRTPPPPDSEVESAASLH